MDSIAETDDPLRLYGHRIVPVEKRAGSVQRWRCLDCAVEVSDAESYLDRECPDDQ